MEIIITTGELKQAYTILQPIFVQISNKGVLKNQYELLEQKYHKFLEKLQDIGLVAQEYQPKKKGSLVGNDDKPDSVGHRMEKAFYIAIEELKKRAEYLKGDAVIAMRYETDLLTNPSGEFYLQMYGTVVKFDAGVKDDLAHKL